jgi:hypothetical protein
MSLQSEFAPFVLLTFLSLLCTRQSSISVAVEALRVGVCKVAARGCGSKPRVTPGRLSGAVRKKNYEQVVGTD